MEIVDILSHYIDKTQNLIIVEFRTNEDNDDVVREDFIEYSYFEEFGFDNNKDFDIFESAIDETLKIDFMNQYLSLNRIILSKLNRIVLVYRE